jgi:hypothetical protein
LNRKYGRKFPSSGQATKTFETCYNFLSGMQKEIGFDMFHLATLAIPLVFGSNFASLLKRPGRQKVREIECG